MQLIDLTQGELDWLAKHMGHEVDIHKMAYRIHTAAVEVAKVGKVLQVLDSTAPGKQTALRHLKGIYVYQSVTLVNTLIHCYTLIITIVIQCIHLLHNPQPFIHLLHNPQSRIHLLHNNPQPCIHLLQPTRYHQHQLQHCPLLQL